MIHSTSFSDDVRQFVYQHKLLCICTLGTAIVGYSIGNLVGRAVTWLVRAFDTTEKTNTVYQETMSRKENQVESQLLNESPQFNVFLERLDLSKVQNPDQFKKDMEKLFLDEEIDFKLELIPSDDPNSQFDTACTLLLLIMKRAANEKKYHICEQLQNSLKPFVDNCNDISKIRKFIGDYFDDLLRPRLIKLRKIEEQGTQT